MPDAAVRRINMYRLCCQSLKIRFQRGNLGIAPRQIPSAIVITKKRRIVFISHIISHRESERIILIRMVGNNKIGAITYRFG